MGLLQDAKEKPKMVATKHVITRLEEPKQPQPVEVEILPEEQEALSLKPTVIESLVTSKSETLRLLENLDKRLIEGKISEETYKKLRVELEEKLEQVNANLKEKVENELSNLRMEISQAEAKRASKAKELEEYEARYLIGQITREEYEQRKSIIEKEVEEIAAQISSKQKRIQELKELICSE